jgi:hypothetical protein
VIRPQAVRVWAFEVFFLTLSLSFLTTCISQGYIGQAMMLVSTTRARLRHHGWWGPEICMNLTSRPEESTVRYGANLDDATGFAH